MQPTAGITRPKLNNGIEVITGITVNVRLIIVFVFII